MKVHLYARRMQKSNRFNIKNKTENGRKYEWDYMDASADAGEFKEGSYNYSYRMQMLSHVTNYRQVVLLTFTM